MAQQEQVLDRAQRLQQALVNGTSGIKRVTGSAPIPDQPVYSCDAPIETIRMPPFLMHVICPSSRPVNRLGPEARQAVDEGPESIAGPDLSR